MPALFRMKREDRPATTAGLRRGPPELDADATYIA